MKATQLQPRTDGEFHRARRSCKAPPGPARSRACRSGVVVAAALSALLAAGAPAAAQTATATTGIVSGAITDATGLVLPGVTVVLTDLRTNASQETVSTASGRYSFVSVLPGRYRLTATLEGFQQTVIPEVIVEVNKSLAVDLKLGVGQVSEVVEVSATASVALQQNDSTVVNTLGEDTVLRLPNPTRSIESIQFNQPLAIPYVGADSNRTRAGSVAGARTDQNTYTLDGADVSDNVVGDNFLESLPSAVVPLPAESVEEFSAASTNANATFGRGSGAQFVIVTKRGTNTYRGSGYWYVQDDALNANTWDRERLGQPKAPLEDNRLGFSLGGPIFQDKTFFFTNYEARRFPRTTQVSRTVPSDSLKAGLLRFRDAAGNVNTYNVRALDPRGIGLNPVVSSVWNMMPTGNDPSRGDDFNTIGFTADADTSFNSDAYVLRLDHNFNTSWRADANYRFGSIRETGAAQADIAGILPGNTPGVPVGTEDLPREPRLAAVGLTGQVTPRFLNETRFSFVRAYLAFTRVSPFPQVPGTNVALDIGGVDEPINVGISQARSQVANDHNYQLINNSTWIRDRHTLLFGGTWRREYWYFLRNEQLAGSLTSPVGNVTTGNFVTIPTGSRPPTCSATVTTNCLVAADVNRFSQLYAASLGLVDNISVLAMRDTNLQPLPLGTPQDLQTTTDSFELYVNDTWRVKPNFTLNLGLSYQFQLSPQEKFDRYAFLIDTASGEILNSDVYVERARRAAEAGQPYNPTLGFQTLASTDRGAYYDVDWSNLGPRLAATWNPPYETGWLGTLFKRDRSVLRGGYGLLFDRTNSVRHILSLGMGYGENLSVLAPRCDANGVPGPGCNATASAPTGAYRIGIDGPAPVPSIQAATSPIIPSGLTVATFADPKIKTGRTHSFNFSYQRELPWRTFLETGWVLRLGRELPQASVLSSVPFFHLDTGSGQTFAQAYDLLAEQLRSGVPAAAVTAQPWFENQIGSGQTASLAAAQSAAIIDGNLSGLWLQVNARRIAGGREPLSNTQMQTLWSRGDGGRSYYQAFYAVVRRRTSNGLTLNASYTLSKARDQSGRRQNSITAPSSAFDLDIDWGAADFDRTHVFNLTTVYDLPFGRSGGSLDRLTGGWYVAGIFSATSGIPLNVCQRSGVYGGGLVFSGCVGAIRVGGDISSGSFEGVTGSGGVGTSGNPATGGTGINMFQDPEAVYDRFRRVQVSQDPRAGRDTLRGLPRWNLDLAIGKRTRLAGSVNAVFTAEIVNVFNSLQYGNGSLNFNSPANFGVITSQANTPRQIQFGVRVEF
ncbi:MAG TPA: carboxypeptidase-like regulatory domain-containing protein [Vicinamibacterales bacterium]|nr:carboxypeptidase-like regulatory domain-containing protein [Vicinamibacterales bacterium]